MSRHPKTPHSQPHPPAYRRAFERLDAALATNTESSFYRERIELLGRHMFGDLWRPRTLDETTNPSH